jgi:hypothetical protein
MRTEKSRLSKCGYCHRWECSCYAFIQTDGPDDEIAELRTEHARLTQERDELKYRLQTWNDVHADRLSAPASEAPKEQG